MPSKQQNMNNEKRAWLYDILFIFILLMAGYLRIGGYDWGKGYHQHPDELFLSGVLDDLRAQPVKTRQFQWMAVCRTAVG